MGGPDGRAEAVPSEGEDSASTCKCSGSIVEPGARMNARVSTFSNSRTFPGQLYWVSLRIAASLSVKVFCKPNLADPFRK